MKPASARGLALLNETAAVLIGVDPTEHDLLEEIHATLGHPELASLLGAALPHVEEARGQLAAILDGSHPDPGSALVEAIASIHNAIAALEAAQKTSTGPAGVSPSAPRSPGAPTAEGNVASPGSEEVGSPTLGCEGERDHDHNRAPDQESVGERDSDAMLDLDILEEFVNESLDHMELAEEALLGLDSQRDNAEVINTIFRAFHTIKSTSSLLGLAAITTLAHAAEGVLDEARRDPRSLAGADADRVLEVVDVLKVAIGALRGGARLDPTIANRMNELAAALELAPASESPEARARHERYSPISDEHEGADRRQSGAAASEDSVAAMMVAARPPVGGEGSASPDASVRVTTARLDSLVNLVGELVVAQALITNDAALRRDDLAQLAQRAAHAHKILRRLQDLAMSLRMVPLRATFQKVARLVHDLGAKSGKQVRLVSQGEDTEIDRNMVEHLNDPLIHMVRNAVGHGIEIASERSAAGKPEMGTITLRAFHAAGHVIIELEDDGRGLDREAIRATAIARGLLAADAQPSEAELASLIWLPGFSTAPKVSEVAGRGVGMDVVKRSIEALRGRIDLRSEQGQGTLFSMCVPLTMAIIDAVLVEVGATRMLLPTVAIVESLQPRCGSISSLAGKALAVRWRDEVIRILRLASVLGVPGAIADPYAALLVIIDNGGTRCALQVDRLLGQQQVVIKSLGAGFKKVRGVAGAAILANGRVGLILDPAGLIGMANVDPANTQPGVDDDHSGSAGSPQCQAQPGAVSHLRAWS